MPICPSSPHMVRHRSTCRIDVATVPPLCRGSEVQDRGRPGTGRPTTIPTRRSGANQPTQSSEGPIGSLTCRSELKSESLGETESAPFLLLVDVNAAGMRRGTAAPGFLAEVLELWETGRCWTRLPSRCQTRRAVTSATRRRGTEPGPAGSTWRCSDHEGSRRARTPTETAATVRPAPTKIHAAEKDTRSAMVPMTIGKRPAPTNTPA